MKILKPEKFEKQTTFTPQVFIGYDERQAKSFDVCKQSILDNASGPVDIYKLDHKDLRRKGLFWREWGVDPLTGNFYDMTDGLPFSNQFAHTRFLVPQYCLYLGIREEMALFVDTDFVFFDDVYKLFEESYNKLCQVFVVKHDYSPSNDKKMDGQEQIKYPKKLWSSLMLFNIYECTSNLNLNYVNTASSKSLHRFEWCSDNMIGDISESWNFIPNHSEDHVDKIQAIHYTEGLPDIKGYEDSKYSRYYLDYKKQLEK